MPDIGLDAPMLVRLAMASVALVMLGGGSYECVTDLVLCELSVAWSCKGRMIRGAV